VIEGVRNYIREHSLVKPGDRIGIAVSGGADSVALFRLMLALREELGIVLSVLHFNHLIRGADADADEAFVLQLAAVNSIETHTARGDAPEHARKTGVSLETAARELRYAFFRERIKAGEIDRAATAHTLDDQAETVLMRLIRGAGTRGLSGIFSAKEDGSILRPLLSVARADIETYLKSIDQDWREDRTNQEKKHLRNRIRHELLPALVRHFNPAIKNVLSRTAEIARAEEEFWSEQTASLLPLVQLAGKPTRGGGRDTSGVPSLGLSVEALLKQPLALRRRLVRASAESLGIELDADHVEEVLALIKGKGKAVKLPGAWGVTRSFRELQFEKPGFEKPGFEKSAKRDISTYSFHLPVPGSVLIQEINTMVHARLEPRGPSEEGYNSETIPGELLISNDTLQILTVRSWRPGDRFWPAHTRSEKKVKDLLQEMKVPQARRGAWPVVEAGETLVWIQRARPRQVTIRQNDKLYRLIIESEEPGK
jgi:tRNA(Ile)-lysidine synthase